MNTLTSFQIYDLFFTIAAYEHACVYIYLQPAESISFCSMCLGLTTCDWITYQGEHP